MERIFKIYVYEEGERNHCFMMVHARVCIPLREGSSMRWQWTIFIEPETPIRPMFISFH